MLMESIKCSNHLVPIVCIIVFQIHTMCETRGGILLHPISGKNKSILLKDHWAVNLKYNGEDIS